MDISTLNQYSLRKFHQFFASLSVPETTSVQGKYRGSFVGPAWLRVSARPTLVLTGLGGWWGKDIMNNGTAINIVLRDGTFSTRFPMQFVKERSFIDGKDGVTLHYSKGNPFPWMFIVDEIRRIDGTTLLGMTRATIPGLRWFTLPFVLQKQTD